MTVEENVIKKFVKKLSGSEYWAKMIEAMQSNKRPTLHGKILSKTNVKLYSKRKHMKSMMDYKNYDFGVLTKDYLLKKDGSLRDNAHLVTRDVLILINYLCYKIYKVYGHRKNVYYSGNFGLLEFFYNNSYEKFQKLLFSTYSSYNYYVKIDIKNFYKSIDLKVLEKNYPETKSIVQFLKYININEFPILQDCSGLSYVATRLYLAELDSDIEKYINSNTRKYEMIRYSDDLYILFTKKNNFGDLGKQKSKEKIKLQFEKILKTHNLALNEKFIIEETTNLPNDVQMKLYDYYVEDKDFDIWELIGEKTEVLRKITYFISELKNTGDVEEYGKLIRECFSYRTKGKQKFEKNFFNEVLYNPSLQSMLRNEEIIKLMQKEHIIEYLGLDPQRLTLVILFSRDRALIKQFLNKTFCRFENNSASTADIVTLLTYITQRNMTAETKENIIGKISLKDKKLAEYLKKCGI